MPDNKYSMRDITLKAAQRAGDTLKNELVHRHYTEREEEQD